MFVIFSTCGGLFVVMKEKKKKKKYNLPLSHFPVFHIFYRCSLGQHNSELCYKAEALWIRHFECTKTALCIFLSHWKYYNCIFVYNSHEIANMTINYWTTIPNRVIWGRMTHFLFYHLFVGTNIAGTSWEHPVLALVRVHSFLCFSVLSFYLSTEYPFLSTAILSWLF